MPIAAKSVAAKKLQNASLTTYGREPTLGK